MRMLCNLQQNRAPTRKKSGLQDPLDLLNASEAEGERPERAQMFVFTFIIHHLGNRWKFFLVMTLELYLSYKSV